MQVVKYFKALKLPAAGKGRQQQQQQQQPAPVLPASHKRYTTQIIRVGQNRIGIYTVYDRIFVISQPNIP
jgi:hypothetical protein